ncbi:MAG: ATP-dependent DNA helicase RecG [Pirellulales bacterium]
MSEVQDRPNLEVLATPLVRLRTVGPRRAELFERLGLRTVLDLLFYFPRDYHDLSELRAIGDLHDGDTVSIVCTVAEIELRKTSGRKSLLGVLLTDGQGALRAMWFNQPFLRERFSVGQRLLVSGRADYRGLMWQMVHPRVTWLDPEADEPVTGQVLPIYPLTEGLSQFHVRRATAEALELGLSTIEEAFPPEYLAAHRLWPVRQALQQIHFPADRDSLNAARRRLVYQELFVLELGLSVRRHQQRQRAHAPSLECTAKIDARIRRLIPYELTPGQEQAVREIAADMNRSYPMNRLLQGEVGCGKTVVALYAMLLAVAAGHQAVLMAPTEVLARQHADTLERLLAGSQVRRALLVGGQSAAERQRVELQVAAGEVDLIVGTQAIVQAELHFRRLGLVVIDEQHKFGVRQRATLKQKGLDPHYLVMTATPIPRSITMTLFGDLDLSTIRDTPPGRQGVHTYLAAPEQRDRWWEFLRKKLRAGRQAYVVTPLVDESDEVTATSVEQAYESLTNGELAEFRVGMIHGRLSTADKERTMEAFRAGQLQVLVSTTVVEVGVDVPNATLMTIEGGERFGLSQLHQLRGRVTRGRHAGYCCVFADAQTDEARKRLEAFVASTDGFQLAEVDLEIRGPGDLFGTRQHGLPPLRIADLLRDAPLLDEARRDALELVAGDPGLSRPEHARLRRQMLVRYGRVLELGDVG